MEIKDNVYIEVLTFKNGKGKRLKISPEIESAIYTANALSKAIAKKEIVVTSVFDGSHMIGSKHYEGNAFDMRKWIYTKYQIETLLENLRRNLGKDYDVINESTHIHIEFDPK